MLGRCKDIVIKQEITIYKIVVQAISMRMIVFLKGIQVNSMEARRVTIKRRIQKMLCHLISSMAVLISWDRHNLMILAVEKLDSLRCHGLKVVTVILALVQ
jgi:hypothetical protein